MTKGPASLAIALAAMLSIAAACAAPPPGSGTGNPTATQHAPDQPDTPAALLIFADFRCPHCARFAVSHTVAIAQTMKDEITDGTFTMEYRHFPVLGPQSIYLAEVAECAALQGRFQPFHDSLYKHQYRSHSDPRIPPVNGPGPQLDTVLTSAGANRARIDACLVSGEARQTLDAHLDQAAALRLTYTPALVLNGTLIEWTDLDHIILLVRQAIRDP